MPLPKAEFDRVLPCEFYEPADLMDPDLLYTIPEIARLLQGLDPDAPLDPDQEAVLVDWAIPWVVSNADDLAIGEPRGDDEPGYYGRRA